MPTALDRVQVLLQPDEYAEVSLLAKDERRSLASMAAVLIAEAINARVKAGTFDRDTSNPVYETARRRQEARANGISVDEFVAQEAEKGEMKVTTTKKGAREVSLEEMGVTVEQVMRAMEAIEAAKEKV